MNYYPITTDDFASMADRPADLNIPVRTDVEMTDGRTLKNVLSWGSPACYSLQTRGGKVYGAPCWNGVPCERWVPAE